MLPRTLAELDDIRERCLKMVQRKALLSAGAAAVPVPGLDVGTDVAILMQLLPQINERFGLGPKQIDALSPDTRKILTASSVSLGTEFLGRVLTPQRVITVLQKMGVKKLAGKSAAKIVPIVGSAVAATVSYMVLRRIGVKHINECYEVVRRTLVAEGHRDVIDVDAVEVPTRTR